MLKFFLIFSCSFLSVFLFGQTEIQIFPDSLQGSINQNFKPGVFYVPKTDAAGEDFMGNGIFQNSIRTHVVESALNNAENIDECIAILESVESILIDLSEKCEKFVIIFEKMPAWLSSSVDGSPAESHGWYVLNTVRPRDWEQWQTVVETITDKLINGFGIENAYFEFWNEPDIGSWSGTVDEYLELYKRTYDGVKAIDINLPFGGPAVNYWANNIYWQPAPGFIPNDIADGSLITELLSYGIENGRVPDFITWHNFNLTHQEFSNASNYITYKCAELGIDLPPLLISEWNAPSATRDTPVHKSFLIKSLIEISKTETANNMIAAWQDFEYDPAEFHKEYGLLTYGALRKPAYNAVLLANQLNGIHCKNTSIDPIELLTTVNDDSLYMLLTNYCPPAFFSAFNDILQSGRFNVYDLEDAGFIDIDGGDVTYLESILNGDATIPNDTPVEIAVNNAVSIFQFYDSLGSHPRAYTIELPNYTDSYNGQYYLIDDETNNMQFKYDSLISEGRTQDEAILELLPDQWIQASDIIFADGKAEISLMPNALVLFKVNIDGLGSVINEFGTNYFNFYPNPSNHELTFTGISEPTTFKIYNIHGQTVKTFMVNGTAETISISNLEKGIYFIGMVNESNSYQKFIKH
ncbi:GH39 family glycosyl hydrolase [Crocinitomix catalasitica]|uniref:GH39 family glycosyl hydrolase n=1 Tax=Crocinitomix catalasitica TaxID=184607 RepID=UPI00146F9482|nr:T9SS type A sorting domain-containing protein [Crocinitomix catalasitica]